MRVAAAVAEILKREGTEFLIAYPINPLIEAAAAADIRTIIVRQERVGLHMADAVGRLSSGGCVGVVALQHGPGAENAFGGIAQAYGESVPLLVLAAGYPRHLVNIPPYYSAFLNTQRIVKWSEQVNTGASVPDVLRRAFAQARTGRPRPVLVEFPLDVFAEEVAEPLGHRAVVAARSAPDPRDAARAAEALVAAARPVIWAGQGVHYARAWEPLRRLAELLEAPVATSLGGKSSFPEDHPLSAGTGGRGVPRPVHHVLGEADLIFGVGCSFAASNFAVAMPRGKTVVHATLDPADLHRTLPADHALLGDAGLTLEALLAEVGDRLGGRPRGREGRLQALKAVKADWLAEWMPKLTSEEVPLSPYRVIWDLMHTVDRAQTVITHDAGNPRDQLSPFWQAVAPLSYLGWGKTTQLGYGLGLAMGAKLAAPEKLCINVWGDAAIGMTGMDFETAVRERLPILSVMLNNFSMATELGVMPISTRKYRSTDISGNYALLAQALGGYGERVERPEEIVPAIRRGIRKTHEGVPVLLEFLTAQETAISK